MTALKNYAQAHDFTPHALGAVSSAVSAAVAAVLALSGEERWLLLLLYPACLVVGFYLGRRSRCRSRG